MPCIYGPEMLRLGSARLGGRARACGIAAAVAIVLCAVGCAGKETWRRAAPVTGYASCGDQSHPVLRVWYEAGLGVSVANASVTERSDVIAISITIQGAGDYPAIAEERWVDVDLASPVAGREVVDENGNKVDERACPSRS